MKFLLGIVAGILLVIATVYFYFRFGYAPVATAAPPIPFEIRLAHMALHAQIEKEAPKTTPFQPTQTDYEDGAHLYRQHCAVCHGLTDQEQTATAKGMFPKPPHLLRGTGVTDDEPGETYWKVAHGIRLTGMPAYAKSLSAKDMWDISFVLAHADKLPTTAQAILRQPALPQ